MMLLSEISNDSTLVTTHYQRLNQDGEFEGQSDDYIPYDQRLEPYIVPVLFGFIFLLGVIGNGSLIFILCCKKSMRNLPNMFIFNLALGDLLVLVFTVPFTSTIYTFDSWPYGEFVCKASEFAKVLIICFIIFPFSHVGINLLKEIFFFLNVGYVSGRFRLHVNGTQFRSLHSHCSTSPVICQWSKI